MVTKQTRTVVAWQLKAGDTVVVADRALPLTNVARMVCPAIGSDAVGLEFADGSVLFIRPDATVNIRRERTRNV